VPEINAEGFGVELAMNWSPEPNIFDKANWPKIKSIMSESKNISIHSKCDNKDWDSLKKEIELTAFLDAKLLVVHVLNFGVVEMENKLEIDEEYFKNALDFAKANKVILALENGFFSSLKRFCKIAKDAENLKICFDIGHANNPKQSLLEKDSAKAFIDEFGQKITHLHFHDNNGEVDEHLVPGEGNIDWQTTMNLLKESDIKLSGALELRGKITDTRKAYNQARSFLEKTILKND
jgi:sugar phosphate isomerase/epimerase